MQLKKSRAIRHKLALASSALLLSTPGTHDTQASEMNEPSTDNIGISQLYYQETGRVSVNKTQAIVSKKIGEKDTIKLNYVYDTMSGASPNGRIYTGSATTGTQTITGVSGAANGNSTSWKTNFQDTRNALNGEWEHKFFRQFTGIFGAGSSKENDYNSNTFSGKALLDINQRRTTLTAGFSVSLDTVIPFGGVPNGGSKVACNALTFTPTWLDCDAPNTISKPADKVVNDYLFGITQVWNKRTLMQLNFAYSVEDGYLTDPYKQVSVLNSNFPQGEVAILYEKRPRARNTRSLYYKVVHVPTDNTAIYFSYRLFWDDWDVKADTFDGRLRMNISPRVYIQTHARAHWQTAAKFFRPYVGADPGSLYYEKNGPEFVSADSRLSTLVTFTAGAKLGVTLNSSSQISLRIEKMTQRYDNRLLPTMQVMITQVNLIFRF